MEERLVTMTDVAERLRISRRAVWAMLSSKRFGPEVIRLGRAVRVRAAELSDWVRDGCPTRADWLQRKAAKKGEVK